MTKLVPAGHMLLSEVRKTIIDKDPAARRAWDSAIKTELHDRASLRDASDSISRHDLKARGDQRMRAIASARDRRDDLYGRADARIRMGLLSGSLKPVTFKDDQTELRIAEHDWRGVDFNSGRIWLEIERKQRRAHVYFKCVEVDKFLSQSRKTGEALAIAACEKWLLSQFPLDPECLRGRDDFKAAALAELGVGPKWFTKAWSKVAPPVRRQAGAKRKSPRA
jgi:hypothetical protein